MFRWISDPLSIWCDSIFLSILFTALTITFFCTAYQSSKCCCFSRNVDVLTKKVYAVKQIFLLIDSVVFLSRFWHFSHWQAKFDISAIFSYILLFSIRFTCWAWETWNCWVKIYFCPAVFPEENTSSSKWRNDIGFVLLYGCKRGAFKGHCELTQRGHSLCLCQSSDLTRDHGMRC